MYYEYGNYEDEYSVLVQNMREEVERRHEQDLLKRQGVVIGITHLKGAAISSGINVEGILKDKDVTTMDILGNGGK